jgi:hypothetical protein
VIKAGKVMMLGAIALGVSSRRRNAGPDTGAEPGADPDLEEQPAGAEPALASSQPQQGLMAAAELAGG